MPTRLEQFEAMAKLDASDPFVLYALGMEYKGAGRAEDAVRTFTDLRAKFPDYVPGYHICGQVLFALGRRDEAAEWLRAGIAAAQKKGDLHARDEMAALLAESGGS